jgi:L-ascorbate metabolism protein UlaG (beta-lactamase superfamily)
MKIRYLGHSCVEIVGKHHILIDPDFTREPLPSVEFICVSHAHMDHIGKIAQVPEGVVLASPEVCKVAREMGMPDARLKPVKARDQIATITILPGYSAVKDPRHFILSLIFRLRIPEPGGVPLSFLVHDAIDLLHIGDAHRFPHEIHPDILCLPWRTSPVGPEKYKSVVIEMAKRMAVPYILPIHYDLPNTEADPMELKTRIDSTILDGANWHIFDGKEVAEDL